MTRRAMLLSALPPALLIAGCERPPAEPRPETNTSASFDNAAAAQSIMQPEVAAENPPAPSPTPSPTPDAPQSLTVAFAGGARIDDAAGAALDDFLRTVPADARLVLRGHSDATGSDAANLVQSRRRAEAVRAYLAERGIDRGRMTVVALGERRPAAPNANLDGSDDPAGRARNRRVEVEVAPARRQPEPGAPNPAAPDPEVRDRSAPGAGGTPTTD